jgi:hypothetical protein
VSSGPRDLDPVAAVVVVVLLVLFGLAVVQLVRCMPGG